MPRIIRPTMLEYQRAVPVQRGPLFHFPRIENGKSDRDHDGPLEIALAGDLTENQADLCEKLLSVEPGGE